MRKTNMILVLCLTASIFTSAAAQSGCVYKHDKLSPFYWTGQKDLCPESMCSDPNFEYDCRYPYSDIHAAVNGHKLRTGEDIWAEIGILERHFNNSFPPEYFHSTKDYTCQGVCDRPVVPLERIFFDYVQRDAITKEITKTSRELCFIIGPKIHYTGCSGEPCHIEGIQAGTDQYNCVPNVVTSVSVWLYCPNVVVGSCVKTTIDVPMSCSCVRFNCPYSLVDTAVAPSPGQGLGSSFGDLLSGISLSGGNLGLGGGSVADPFGISGSVGGDLFPSGPVPVDVGSLAGGSNPGMAGWSDAFGPAGMHLDSGRQHSIV